MGGTVYLVDANVWIDSHEKHYPIDVFPSVWKALENGIKSGVIRSPRQVLRELGDGQKGVSAWCSMHKAKLFLKETANVMKSAGEVMRDFQGLTSMTAHDPADPWLVAFGREHGYIVTTSEKRNNSLTKPKIPTVCDHYGVQCCTPIELLRFLKVKL